VGLAFAIAASANFPVLFLSMYWRRLTTRGAMIGGWLGLLTAVVLVICGPVVWVEVLGNNEALFPYKYPALFSVTVAFIAIGYFSLSDRSEQGEHERQQFDQQLVRSQTGLGASTVSRH